MPPAREPGTTIVDVHEIRGGVGQRRATELLDGLRRATLAVVDLAGHHLGRIARPTLLHALVRDRLTRLELSAAW